MKLFTDYTLSELRERGTMVGSIGRPTLIANHIDGPVIHFTDGQMHWLGFLDRIKLWLGFVDADQLQRKLRPRLTAELEVYWQRGMASKSMMPSETMRKNNVS